MGRPPDSRRRTPSRPGHSRPATPPQAKRSVLRWQFLWPVAILVAVAAWLGIHASSRQRDRDRPETESPAAQLDATLALARGVELGRHGRHHDSLPFFRRAAEVGTGWLVHWDYAAALNNAAMEPRDPFAFTSAASRTAFERVALARAALAEVRLAEQQAPSARARTMMQLVRGRTLEWWGFPRDALEEYSAALANEPDSPQAQRAVRECLAGLHAGTRSIAARHRI